MGRVVYKHDINPDLVRAIVALHAIGLLAEDRQIQVAGARMTVRDPLLDTLPDLRQVEQVIVEKDSLDIFTNPNIEALLARLGEGQEVILYGVVTEICVAYAARGLLDRGYKLRLVRDAVHHLDEAKARALLGEQVMRRVFEIDAARADLELGIGATWHGMETTGMDGTTIELFNNDELADAFGVPAGGTKPKIRIAAHVRTGSRRWIAAAIGGYHDGENKLADQLEASFTAGMVNLADRGFFSMDRWIRFSEAGAHLAWRVKNGAKSVPFTTLRTLSDGSELVLLHESASMLGKRRRDASGKTLPRLPDTIARLVSFTVTARTARRARTTTVKVLTTLLDPGAFPAREIAALYAERWQAEIAYLHLKKTVKGAGRVLRGRSPALARQETWALLLVHNMTATIAARAAASAGIDPDQIPFTAVLSLIRGYVTADACCPHCGKRPASGNDPIALLIAGILAQPPHRDRPARTSGRTPFQRRAWHTEEVAYTITIIPSNLPKATTTPGS